MVLATRLELFQVQEFLSCGEEIFNPVWYILESEITFKNTMEPRMSQTVVPAALRKSPYMTFLEKSRNCNKWTFEDVPQA